MDPITLVIVIAVAILVLVGALVGLLRGRGRTSAPTAPRPGADYAPGVGDDATPPRDAPKRDIQDVAVLDREPAVAEPELELEPLPELERPAPARGRLHRLRARLARSNSTFGQGLLALLSRDHIDDDTWDEVEETLLGADLGVGPTTELIERLRTEVRVDGIADPEQLRAVLRREMVTLVDPTMDRSLALDAAVGRPAVVLVVGV
ncbi:MAG: signal recognition particle receptor subunit alpha, partial [Angustibacter sp.]